MSRHAQQSIYLVSDIVDDNVCFQDDSYVSIRNLTYVSEICGIIIYLSVLIL